MNRIVILFLCLLIFICNIFIFQTFDAFWLSFLFNYVFNAAAAIVLFANVILYYQKKTRGVIIPILFAFVISSLLNIYCIGVRNQLTDVKMEVLKKSLETYYFTNKSYPKNYNIIHNESNYFMRPYEIDYIYEKGNYRLEFSYRPLGPYKIYDSKTREYSYSQ